MNLFWAFGWNIQLDAQTHSALPQIEAWYNDIESKPNEVLSQVDSLLIKRLANLSNLEKTHLYHIKSDCYYYLDDIRASDAAIQKALDLAPADFDISKLTDMYNSHGQNLDYLGDLPNAINSYDKGLRLAIQMRDSINIGDFYYNLGLSHFALSNFEEALRYIDSSQTLSMLIRDSLGISSVLRVRSNILSHYENLDRAIAASKEGLLYSTEADPELRCFHFLDIANIFYKTNNLDSIYKYVLAGKECSENLGYGQVQLEVYKTFGNYYKEAKDTLRAIAYYDSLVVLADKMGGIQEYYHGLISKYTVDINNDQIDDAIDILKKAEAKGFDKLALSAYYKISEELFAVGRTKEAYQYLLKSNELQEKYNKEDSKRQMEVQSAKFKLYEKEIEAQLAEEKLKIRQSQFITYGVLGVTLFLALIGWISFRNKKSKLLLSQEKLQKETELLREIADVESQAFRAQMNPHFIFNALNSIKGLIVNKQDKEAAIYISKFSKLVRNILDHSRSKTILLSVELDTLEMYIKLEQMRFRDSFEYDIQVDRNIESDSIFIPPVTIQPFVENAIWHGFKNNHRENRIEIKIKEINDELHISIQDNGVGRQDSARQKNRKSHGINITKQRILNFSNDQSADRLSYTDLKDKNGNALGTLVQIRVPLKYQPHE